MVGHATAVASVALDANDARAVAGSSAGPLKLFDLERASAVCSFTGHGQSCGAVTFRPGDGVCVASGAADGIVKVWDTRTRACVHTLRGHTGGISTVRFSPDGQWLASADAGDGASIRIWDLTASRLLGTLGQALGPVAVLDFHPDEVRRAAVMLAHASAGPSAISI